MKILSIDTSSNICGVSILENENLLCKSDINTGTTHSENLMPIIESSFKKVNFSLKDINLIVCDKGPGSFTGIRIGISTAKAFSDSLNIPCIGVSSLECLAYNIELPGLICSIIDCKNDNCYFALYELSNNQYIELIEPSAENIQTVIQKLSNYKNSNITFVGDGVYIFKNILSENFENSIFGDKNNIDSHLLGLAGLNRFNSNLVINTTSENLLPLYLRKPQAQRQLEEKNKI